MPTLMTIKDFKNYFKNCQKKGIGLKVNYLFSNDYLYTAEYQVLSWREEIHSLYVHLECNHILKIKGPLCDSEISPYSCVYDMDLRGDDEWISTISNIRVDYEPLDYEFSGQAYYPYGTLPIKHKFEVDEYNTLGNLANKRSIEKDYFIKRVEELLDGHVR